MTKRAKNDNKSKVANNKKDATSEVIKKDEGVQTPSVDKEEIGKDSILPLDGTKEGVEVQGIDADKLAKVVGDTTELHGQTAELLVSDESSFAQVDGNTDLPGEEIVPGTLPEIGEVKEKTEDTLHIEKAHEGVASEETKADTEEQLVATLKETPEKPKKFDITTLPFIVFLMKYCEDLNPLKRTVGMDVIVPLQSRLFKLLFNQVALDHQVPATEVLKYLLTMMDDEDYPALHDIYLFRGLDSIPGVSSESLLAYSQFLHALKELAPVATRRERIAQLNLESLSQKVHVNGTKLVEDLIAVCTD